MVNDAAIKLNADHKTEFVFSSSKKILQEVNYYGTRTLKRKSIPQYR